MILQIDGGIGVPETTLEYKMMESLINQRNTSPTIIGQRPPMSFAITNNLLTPTLGPLI
jgi:hypothetical protein